MLKKTGTNNFITLKIQLIFFYIIFFQFYSKTQSYSKTILLIVQVRQQRAIYEKYIILV